MLWAIIGLPSSGKSTLFNFFTHKGTSAKTGRGLNVAVNKIPDSRLDKLEEVFQPGKKTHLEIEFADTVGQFGKGGALFSELQRADALVYCLRAYDAGFGIPDPAAEMEKISSELAFFDLAILDRRLETIEKSMRSAKAEEKRLLTAEREYIEKLHQDLENGIYLRDTGNDPTHEKLISNFALLTSKPAIVVLSCDEKRYEERDELVKKVNRKSEKTQIIPLMPRFELELNDLAPEEAKIFREELELPESSLDYFLQKAYKAGGLLVYYTAGETEVRAWAIEEGSSALDAAGKIHTDLARGFIRAEVITFEELVRIGGWNEAKNEGAIRQEGKTYVVEDGDVILIKFAI